MKADLLLKEIIKNYPDDNVVAIAQDGITGDVYIYFNNIPKLELGSESWYNKPASCLSFDFSKIIEWNSEDWKQKIVTINDLK